MPDQPGTIEQLLTQLANALAPLADELSPALLQDLGIGIPAAWSAQQLRSTADASRHS